MSINLIINLLQNTSPKLVKLVCLSNSDDTILNPIYYEYSYGVWKIKS